MAFSDYSEHIDNDKKLQLICVTSPRFYLHSCFKIIRLKADALTDSSLMNQIKAKESFKMNQEIQSTYSSLPTKKQIKPNQK